MKGKFACVYSSLYVLFLFILQNEPNGVRLTDVAPNAIVFADRHPSNLLGKS